MMNNQWTIQSKLPECECTPNDFAQFSSAQLISGATEDARFIFDVIFSLEKQCFVLTAMEINEEWGFIEHEKRLYLSTLAELWHHIQDFQQKLSHFFDE